jgi:ribonuclease HII
MGEMHEEFPGYDFATHKGYVTREHQAALAEHGPCPQHRRRFVNVRRVALPQELYELDENGWDTPAWETGTAVDPALDVVVDPGVDAEMDAEMSG